ncbi:bifunctional adenosylcobinamide kinase/adenosylcobinamide-phosphate guanylyltransferase [Bacillus aquiflavi]|uniref:Bifunctional adenosylcobinamide kinase/adenosylcobinamide-phosphate guanylyltransferase n=1 Tax=Bacillus aquiflavi TaxID=2672567 RepID=A0A6B3W043_9BACI|nr:bifunctional adenosylcobinamide kinase/adenosylcobinamide-phosphate guanylyltransferase [Bacillus aquiflavi]MBA4536849.1 bifunctional adenosylcobinamide kinase/adenosylcobinamide-phosphate guanylyltransferase [Bacillus aquiflavi]NEY81216.1 hypothetical protein [Bacillus aquiflavi]UAC48474.1 bifunctional adenosylcobinamide kinase/adenosylcobinamide-phosphate guanylyltransferase [Bacillus aquiflavi]
MHFVTGGAFNGKRKWVEERYRLKEHQHYKWISAYELEACPESVFWDVEQFLILEGVEQWIKKLVEKYKDIETCRQKWHYFLQGWIDLEAQKQDRTLIIIGSDITKGIVPVQQVDRRWRDVTGWAFQDAANVAERVDVIWYGLATNLK